MVFYSCECDSPDLNGQYSGVWVSGNLIFTMLVIVSNMKILISSFLISGLLLFFVIGSVAFYFLVFVL